MLKSILKKILPLWLQNVVRKHRIIVIHLINNRRARRRPTMQTPWVNVTPYDVANRVAYSREVYDDYFSWSGIPRSFVKGKRILEIGPGENLAVSLRFLADGAAFAASVDRFASLKSAEEQAFVYSRLIEDLNEGQRKNIRKALTLLPRDYRLDPDRCRYYADTPLEELAKKGDAGRFDLIVSRAVLEHVRDLDAAFAAMDTLLAPGGYLVHEVDFRDHGIFSDFGLNPLTYLTVGDKLWNAMTSHTGAPNRRLWSDYDRLLARHGLESSIQTILLAGSDAKIHKKEIAAGVDYSQAQIDLVRAIRKRLAPAFRNRSDEELLVAGVFITAKQREIDQGTFGKDK